MAALPRLRPHPGSAGGFSLIEIMIGLAIGAFAVVVMLQVFSLAERQKRTATGGSDAQTNGAVALFELQTDISQSGYGISSIKLIGCNVNSPGGTTLPAGVTLTLAPVSINPISLPPGDPNTDTLLVFYGNSASSPEGDGITAQPGQAMYTVQTPASFTVGEKVVAGPSTPCNLVLDQITAIDNAAAKVTVATGEVGMTNGRLYDIGPTPTIRAYAVRSGNLTVCDYTAINNCSDPANKDNTSVWVPFVSNIVSLRAEYGVDTVPRDAIADSYNQTAATACEYAGISALRFVVVARSIDYEKTAVTAAAPAWMGSAAINLSAYPNGKPNPDWKNYRYTLFQTVVPIRNISWLGVQAGC
jgi:type IV pilus assembly protein PilW